MALTLYRESFLLYFFSPSTKLYKVSRLFFITPSCYVIVISMETL